MPDPMIVSSEPSLIATFYGRRDELHGLHRRLYWAFLGEDLNDPPRSWHRPDASAFGNLFDPVAAPDTTVLQVAINLLGPASFAWPTMQKRLASCLDDEVLESLWGYTLVYEASAPTGIGIDVALAQVMPIVPTICSSQGSRYLADMEVRGGRLWLLDVPGGDGLSASTIYIALSPVELEEGFVSDTLYGSTASMLMPELIAHKSYYQMRQYRTEELKERFVEVIASVRQAASRTLRGLSEQLPASADLEELIRAYIQTNQIVPEFSRLRNSLQIQLHNYDRWYDRIGTNGVLQYHRDHIDTAVVELELMVADGRDAIDLAKTVVDMAQVRVDRDQELRQQRLGTILTVLAVALAVPAVLDPSVANEILRLCGFTEPAGGFNVLLLFALRVSITVLLLLIALLAVNALDSRPGRRRSATR